VLTQGKNIPIKVKVHVLVQTFFYRWIFTHSIKTWCCGNRPEQRHHNVLDATKQSTAIQDTRNKVHTIKFGEDSLEDSSLKQTDSIELDNFAPLHKDHVEVNLACTLCCTPQANVAVLGLKP